MNIAAHLHDIGKIGVPDAVLNKEGKLDDEAMTSNRSYRKAHDFDYCYQEIKNNLGKMYDPIIGQYVLDHWEEIISVIKISR